MADYELNGGHWRTKTITWSLISGSVSNQPIGANDWLVSGLLDLSLDSYNMLTDIRTAFIWWYLYTGYHFVQVSDGTNVDIRFGLHHVDEQGGTLATTYFLHPDGTTIRPDSSFIDSIAIMFDRDETYTYSAFYGDYVQTGGIPFINTAIHEIGHALGLGHYDGDLAIMNTNANTLTGLTTHDINGIEAVVGLNPPHDAQNDFDGDGASDILWRNNTSGAVAVYEMDGSQVIATGWVGGSQAWSIVGTEDFNGDGWSDILWRNNTSGAVAEYQMNGSRVIATGWVGGSQGWSVVGTGDFNGDGWSDILWRNNTSGAVAEYQMNGFQVTATGWVGGSQDWSIVGTGDFNGDGQSDILWRNNASGAVAEYQMNGFQVTATGWVGGSQDWSIVGIGDFNGDGRSDILWRNNTSGAVAEYQMNGFQVTATGWVGGSQDWSIVGTGDFNGDGRSDILWRNNTSGAVAEYQMNGFQVTATGWVGGSQDWLVVG